MNGVLRGGKQEATRAGSGNLGEVGRLLGGLEVVLAAPRWEPGSWPDTGNILLQRPLQPSYGIRALASVGYCRNPGNSIERTSRSQTRGTCGCVSSHSSAPCGNSHSP